MVLSLAVVLVGVLVFFVFGMPHGSEEPDVKVVDTEIPLASFARGAPYQAAAPTGLPDYWKPTSIRVQLPDEGGKDGIAQVTIGYVVDRPDDRRFARYVQSNDPDVVEKILDGHEITGSVEIAGQTWEERRDGDDHLAFTRTADGVTMIIEDGGKGGADQPDLETLAEAVRVLSPRAE